MSRESNPPTAVVTPVSSAHEQLILVDAEDRVTGHDSKRSVHAGQGRLHRAFSVFLFDDSGRVLLHRRSNEKPLWPGYWTNSCCSHPRRGESIDGAAQRRLGEELGVSARDLHRVYSFEYHAAYEDVGSEHELCHVFLARCAGDSQVQAHEQEIAEWRWFELAEVDALVGARADRRVDALADAQLSDSGEDLTPWFCMEWRTLRQKYASVLGQFATGVEPPRSVA